jgi:hypothetical protein
MLVVTPLFTACGEPNITTEKGWKRYDKIDARFSIAIPEGWIELSASNTKLDEVLANIRKTNVNLAQDLEGTVRNSDAKFKFRAYDLTESTIASNFLPGVNVVQLPNPKGISLDQHLTRELNDIKTRYRDELTSSVNASTITLPAGDAFRFKYSFRITRDSGDVVDYEVIQYYLLIDDDYYLITAGASSEQVEQYAGTFQGIAESFRRLK